MSTGEREREFELVDVEAGLKSLRSLEFGQTFHPVTGPMAEAKALHVDQQRLAERSQRGELVLWDVGLGAAANALAALEALLECGGVAVMHSFDKSTAPLEFALKHADEIEYVAAHENPLGELLANRIVTVARGSAHIEWRLHIGDFRDVVKNDQAFAHEQPHAIFYDPYSPTANPEMWSLEHFSELRQKLPEEAPCLWTNYSRSTSVRVTLLLAGFFVGEGCSIGEKEVTTIASNYLNLIERPLGARWLERVSRSANAAPLRGGVFARSRISAADLEALEAHTQFTDR